MPENGYNFGTKTDAIAQLEDGMGSEGSTEVAERMYDILWNEGKIEYSNGLLRPVTLTDQEFLDLWAQASPD